MVESVIRESMACRKTLIWEFGNWANHQKIRKQVRGRTVGNRDGDVVRVNMVAEHVNYWSNASHW